jgi:HD-GYP domain-containing protein (c-di-GMP phosphodiesterase class II)
MNFTNYEDLIGKRLAEPILNTKGMLIIPAETILLENHIAKLEKFNISAYDIHVELVEEKFEEAAAAEQILEPAFIATGGIVNQTSAMLHGIETIVKKTGKIPIMNVEEILLPTILQATQKQNIYKLFAELKAEDDFIYKHSIGVAYIASLLGRTMKLNETELALLTIAASLCDIGTIRLPASILQKTTELNPQEFEQMKQHTIYGNELLSGSELDSRIALVALQHHERDDGSGYPKQLDRTEIHLFSKIVALADVYVAMTSERPQRAALPFYQVINHIYEDIMQNRFDSKIGFTFLNMLMSAQVGREVILSNGATAKIILINANDPASPLISFDNQFIDLSKNKTIHIIEIIG